MLLRSRLCWYCKHYHEEEIGRKCNAYPDEIPDEVFWTSHWTPYKGDNGIMFEPISAIDEEMLRKLKKSYTNMPKDFRPEWVEGVS